LCAAGPYVIQLYSATVAKISPTTRACTCTVFMLAQVELQL
jgi:hypothetical protein